MARVLLVEDEAAILMLLAEALADAGHDVVEASTAEAAEAAMALDDALDVLVTDINVGIRGWGFGFAKRVRELHPTVPVLYITGDSERHVAANGVPGARTLPKPFTPGELVRAVSAASAPAR